MAFVCRCAFKHPFIHSEEDKSPTDICMIFVSGAVGYGLRWKKKEKYPTDLVSGSVVYDLRWKRRRKTLLASIWSWYLETCVIV